MPAPAGQQAGGSQKPRDPLPLPAAGGRSGAGRCGVVRGGAHAADVAGEAVAGPAAPGIPGPAEAQRAASLPHRGHVGVGGLPGRRVHGPLHHRHRLPHRLPPTPFRDLSGDLAATNQQGEPAAAGRGSRSCMHKAEQHVQGVYRFHNDEGAPPAHQRELLVCSSILRAMVAPCLLPLSPPSPSLQLGQAVESCSGQHRQAARLALSRSIKPADCCCHPPASPEIAWRTFAD